MYCVKCGKLIQKNTFFPAENLCKNCEDKKIREMLLKKIKIGKQ